MDNIRDIVRKTLVNLDAQKILPTPKAYGNEFCKVAKSINFTVEECSRFENILKSLSDDEQIFVKENKITDFDDLITLLLQRAKKENIDNMATILQKSMKPSISLTLNEDLHQFSIKIGNSPELIFENEIQHEIEKFIDERIKLDQEELEKKAKEITLLMTYMTKFLGDTIDINSKGSDSISKIAKEIEGIDANDAHNLKAMQGKLVGAAKSIETHISQSTQSLQSGKESVVALQKKVEQLEKELQQVRKESEIDHLTGLLTRRWYDRQSKRFDDNFRRNGVNYAIAFFDIDHFKKVNDTYGHEAGDVVLSTFAKVLLKSTRDTDILGRYGGEEFISLVQFTNIKELYVYMERIKLIVTGHMFKYNDIKIPITFSAGVTIRSSNDSHEHSVKKADELLYKAKQSGRNKIIFEDGKEF
ncbi:MAG: GGDEF domain-containing protein [Arcobacteraceae bacterium]|nr:GGDEF domain-containing protein [Arcobacteraceae bacterium]